MSWVRVGQTDIHYVEAGAGRPLVFLHGFGSCAEAWGAQVHAFADRFRVLAYDSVNHGHSANSPRDEPEPDRADELEGFLTALKLERPLVAGNSMGALTLLRWAIRHPEGATALIPSGMGVAPPDQDATMPASTRRALFDPVTEDVLFLPAEGGFTPGFADREPEAYARYVRLRSTATRIEASRHPRVPTMTSPAREELADAVKAITAPMQIVVGEHDWLLEAARELHRRVPGSALAEIPGAPHNAYFEAADRYNEIVDGFLSTIRP